jgi:hypothetical protein
MTVKESLRISLLLYPSILQNKWAVYHHWFAVNGNGYEWENGELVDICGEKNVTITEAINKHFKYRTKNIFKSTFIFKYNIKELKNDILATINVKNRTTDFTQTEELYPLCEYAKILNIPNDIKPDWLDAIKEFYDYLIKNYDNFSENDKSYIDKIQIP